MTLEGKPFTLYCIREILDSFADAPPLIEELIESAEQAVAEESASTFELSKSLIDTTCKTILIDRGVEISRNWDTPQLFRETQNQLNFIPPEHPNPQLFQNGITGILRGLQQSIQGFCELRNSEGIIAHGQDGYKQISFLAYQLQFVARASDAIVHFLFSAHRRNPSGSRANRIYYEENPKFNDYIDEFYEGAVIFEQVFSASRILYNSDKDHSAYREMLRAWEIDVEAGLIAAD